MAAACTQGRSRLGNENAPVTPTCSAVTKMQGEKHSILQYVEYKQQSSPEQVQLRKRASRESQNLICSLKGFGIPKQVPFQSLRRVEELISHI
jgi:hypothetical protein